MSVSVVVGEFISGHLRSYGCVCLRELEAAFARFGERWYVTDSKCPLRCDHRVVSYRYSNVGASSEHWLSLAIYRGERRGARCSFRCWFDGDDVCLLCLWDMNCALYGLGSVDVVDVEPFRVSLSNPGCFECLGEYVDRMLVCGPPVVQ